MTKKEGHFLSLHVLEAVGTMLSCKWLQEICFEIQKFNWTLDAKL